MRNVERERERAWSRIDREAEPELESKPESESNHERGAPLPKRDLIDLQCLVTPNSGPNSLNFLIFPHLECRVTLSYHHSTTIDIKKTSPPPKSGRLLSPDDKTLEKDLFALPSRCGPQCFSDIDEPDLDLGHAPAHDSC